MDSTNHAETLRSSAPDGHRPWVRATQTGLFVVLAVALCLMAALGLVAIGIFVVFVFAMSNYGSNK
jgi:hypothetical protein